MKTIVTGRDPVTPLICFQEYWQQYYTDDESAFDRVVDFDVSNLAPLSN